MKVRPISLLLAAFMTLLMVVAHGQNIGINVNGAAPDPTALLDIDVSGITGTKRGLLIPRITSAERTAMSALPPANGLLVYDTSVNGFWFWNTALSAWVPFATIAGWSVLGNAGTLAGTNFLGTTDAVALVIKTGGSAASNERMRWEATGRTLVNNTSGSNTDVFSVYATGSSSSTPAIAALGVRAINGYASGSAGVGVYGTTSGTVGSYGMLGTATGAAAAVAVQGEGSSPTSVGVFGIGNVGASSLGVLTGRGVVGQVNGTAGAGIAIGVSGQLAATMTTGDARGVNGRSPSEDGMGVAGFATTTAATSGMNPTGVWGQVASTNGLGVFGYNTVTGIVGAPVGVLGTALSDVGVGVYGQATSALGNAAYTATGVLGEARSSKGFGVNGVNTSTTGTGVLGEGNNVTGSYLTGGSGGAFTGQTIGTYGLAKSNVPGVTGAPARAGGYFESGSGATLVYTYVAAYEGTGVPRKVMGNGTVNTVVQDAAGNHVLLSAPEAPENLFQDHGSGTLVNGHAHIALDPTLSRNILVDGAHPLRAMVQMRGECNGAYVINGTSEGFDVVEFAQGVSNASFFWTVTANRADVTHPDGTVWRFSTERFAPTQGPQVRGEVAPKGQQRAIPVVKDSGAQ